MKIRPQLLLIAGLALLLASRVSAQTNVTFVVGAFNVENWNSIERHGQLNQPKPQAEKEAVISVIAHLHPDVLGLAEMGTPTDLAELRAGLADHGVVYPFWEHLQAADHDRRVCLLSRFPIVARQSRTDETYRLNGQTLPISRGILDVVIQVNDRYALRAVVAHLKSKRANEYEDQALMRLAEAKLLRAHLAGIFKTEPATKLIAMGDFNDTPGTAPIVTVIGEPPFALFPLPCQSRQGYTGTHIWKFHSEWSRFDYLLASPGLSNDFVTGSAHIYEGRDGSEASDHRLIYASFKTTTTDHLPIAANPTRKLGFTILLLVVVITTGAVLLVVARRQLRQPTA